MERIITERDYCEVKCAGKCKYALSLEQFYKCYWDCFDECCAKSKSKCLEMY